MGDDINFIAILDKLKEIHESYPDLRFGLIMQTALDNAKNTRNFDFHDMNSKKILSALDKFKTETETKRR